jgi:hypothetical protein
MSYNFKSIADVEVVAEPAESANVLIEENGVIKKAPKTAVGGGETLVIAFNGNNWVEAYSGYEIISAPDNLYEVAKEMFENLTYVNIVGCNTSGTNYGELAFFQVQRIYKEDDYYILDLNYYSVNCYPNGQISIWYYD